MNNQITISEFDQHNFEGHPPLGTLVIHTSCFVVVEIIRFDPKEARQGDLVIGVALYGFYIKTIIWL
jgi:hypothetical protein